MRRLRQWLIRLTTSIARQHNDTRLREEIDDHVAFETEANLRRGLPPAEARRRALLTFGSMAALEENYRDQQGVPPLEHLLQDVRIAFRRMWKTPGFTTVAILTLALGIGGTVAIFSAVYTVLYKPLPLIAGERLVVPVSTNPARDTRRGSIPFADYMDWREQRDVFEQVALFDPIDVDISGGQTPERVAGMQVTTEYFATLQAQPLLGRTLIPSDHDAKATRVAVISDGLWKRRFGADPAIAGKPMRLAGDTVAIAGVVPGDRTWPMNTDSGCRCARRCSTRTSGRGAIT